MRLGLLTVAVLVFTPLPGLAQALPASKTLSPGPGSFVDVDGSKLYYEECGDAPQTVLLLHDGIAHSAVWDAVWPAFCKEFHTIRFDRRGYGRSPAGTTLYNELDDVSLLLHHLKVRKTIVIGSSHGGEIAIGFTLQHPEVVQQLVLVGAVVGGLSFSDQFFQRGIENSKPFGSNDVAAGIANWAKDKYLLAPDHDAARKLLLALLTASPQDLTHDDYARPIPPELSRLHEIRVPTLILTGDADVPDVHAHAGAMEAGIPGSRRVMISDSGHLMYLEKPEEFTRTVFAFLDLNSN